MLGGGSRRARRRPTRPTLTERDLGLIDAGAGRLEGVRVLRRQRIPDGPARGHQFVDEVLQTILRQRGVGAAPEPPAHHDVAAIRRRGRTLPFAPAQPQPST